MHYRIACGVTIAVVVFAICSAIGDKIPYEIALTGLIAVLTYWSQAPTRSIGRQLEVVEESGDAEHS
jgi:type III secretory pathway component EscR